MPPPDLVGSRPNCLDKGLPVRTWRLRGLCATIRGSHQDKSDRVGMSGAPDRGGPPSCTQSPHVSTHSTPAVRKVERFDDQHGCARTAGSKVLGVVGSRVIGAGQSGNVQGQRTAPPGYTSWPETDPMLIRWPLLRARICDATLANIVIILPPPAAQQPTGGSE